MNSDDVARLRQRYESRLSTYGYSPETLGWNKPKHRLRYQILLHYWTASTARPRILDFGCGFGDLYGFARDQGIELAYHGIDINPKLVEVARTVYPDAEFTVGDPLTEGLDRTYDVILSSGAHNHLVHDNERYITDTFALFDRFSERGFALNFLSDRVTFRTGENYYAKPEAILELALRYSRRVQLRHDYMPFEFTIFVDKADDFGEDLTVFRDYEIWCSGSAEPGQP